MIPWDDDTADALAITQAVRDDRTGDVAVILRHSSPFSLALTLAKLLAAAADECGASPDHLRLWGHQAVNRS
jgi:hypothetical protein